jgi:hypothetical protein
MSSVIRRIRWASEIIPEPDPRSSVHGVTLIMFSAFFQTKRSVLGSGAVIRSVYHSYHSAGRSLCVVTWCDWSISTLGRKIWSIPTIQQDDHCVSWHDVMWLIDFRPGQDDLIDSYHSAGRSLCVVTWRDVTDRFPPWAERPDRFLPFSRKIIMCRDVTCRDWSISTLSRKIWSIPIIQQEDHCVSWHDVTDRFPPWAERSDPFLPFSRMIIVSWHDVTWLIDFQPKQKDLIDSYRSAGRSLCVVTCRAVADRFPPWAERSDRFLLFSRKIIMCRDTTWRDWSISTLGRKIWSIPIL